jgi:anti-sigma regulatory factor (Ser/Thr protein kinase)
VTARREFPNSPSSIGHARRFAAAALEGVDDEVVETVTLLVSEISTNSIMHARTGFTVEFELGFDVVRVAIADLGSGDPTVRSPAVTDTSGRGLRIVETLSDSWGIEPSGSGRGKTVWFMVGRHALPPL